MALKSLNFVPLPASLRSAVDVRRIKLMERLEDQKKLLADSNYVRTYKRWVKIDGNRSQIEKDAAHLSVVASGSKRLVRLLREAWRKADRVRERQGRNSSPQCREAGPRNQHRDGGGAGRRARSIA